MPKVLGQRRRVDSQQGSKSPSGGAPSMPRIDLLLQRLANASQLGVLVLAVFGYFYTVLPIYQKSLLDEDIAKKTIELREMEAKVAQAEAELRQVSTTMARLTRLAADARAGLTKAQTEVGQLRGTVDSQYQQLLPRLTREFHSIVLGTCTKDLAVDSGLLECVEQRVLNSTNLAPMHADDKLYLLRSVQERLPHFQEEVSTFDAAVAARKLVVTQRKREAQAKCDAAKSSDEYKDRIKSISIDHQCARDLRAAELQESSLKDYFAKEKIVSDGVAAIITDFYKRRTLQ
ncbi:hypothetical protein CDL60_14200 [Roseateles noduli]|nr:hypothetical protein CDL60_14200 [Roseateles noduli]